MTKIDKSRKDDKLPKPVSEMVVKHVDRYIMTEIDKSRKSCKLPLPVSESGCIKQMVHDRNRNR